MDNGAILSLFLIGCYAAVQVPVGGQLFTVPADMSLLDMNVAGVYQSDYLDDNYGHYGLDDDVTSCYVSGSGWSSWWKFVMNETAIIKGFLFKGYFDGLVKFRIGKFHDPLGDMSGHMVNPPCTALNVLGNQDYTLFQCLVPVKGHVVSVEGINPTYSMASSLKICDVRVLI